MQQWTYILDSCFSFLEAYKFIYILNIIQLMKVLIHIWHQKSSIS